MYKLLQIDPYLKDYEKDINLRMDSYKRKRQELLKACSGISAFANGYKYFGFHRTKTGWVYREWAPSAEQMYLTGDFNDWNLTSHPLKKLENGIFEIELKGRNALKEGQKIQAVIIHGG